MTEWLFVGVYFPPEGVKFMLYVTTIAYWPVSPSSYIIELDFGDEFSSTCMPFLCLFVSLLVLAFSFFKIHFYFGLNYF